MPERYDREYTVQDQDYDRAAQDLNFTARDLSRELRATTRLVQEAAQLGKDELLRYVNESMDSARRAAGQFAADIRRQAEGTSRGSYDSGQYARQGGVYREERSCGQPVQSAAVKPRRPVTRGRWALFCVGLPFLMAGWICLIVSGSLLMSYGIAPPALGIVGACLCAVGGGLMGGSAARRILGRQYSRICSFVGDKAVVSLRSIRDKLSIPRRRLERRLEDMVERGYFGGEARLDLDRELLIVDPERAARDAEAEAERIRAERETASRKSEENALDEYERMLEKLRELNERIEDDEMSERIYRIEAVTRATFAAVKEKPEKKAQLRRFMDYYLPTAIKLLNAYAGFERQSNPGENVRKSMESIEKMTATMAEAFEKQFDSLFLTESMDIGAEVRTMDSLLRQDGLIGGMNVPSGGSAVQQKPTER